MNVLDIFYKNILPEATKGRINCYSYYNIVFSSRIVENDVEYNAEINNDQLLIPTLIIRDKEEFDKLLVEYVDLAMKFYDNSNFIEDILDYKMYDNESRICKEKAILALLFANATVEDFNNPCDFLKKRIDFIYNDITGIYNLGYCNILKGDVFINIEKDVINNETPYQIIIKVVSMDGEEFEFPRVKLGISDGVVYIYSIQNKFKEELDKLKDKQKKFNGVHNQDDTKHAFYKKINRILYKIGEGFEEDKKIDNELDDDFDDENLKDITSSFLVALNMSFSYLYNNGYSKIVVPSCLIERWNAKSISFSIKASHKKFSNEEIRDYILSQDNLQHNLTNKFIRTFLRLGCHYNNIDILSFPNEIDSCLHISINDNNIQCNNELLYETYMLVEKEMNKIFSKK